MPRYWSRRELFNRCGGGIGSLALANILAAQDNPLSLKKPHFPAKIKSVISIFCYGGVSHIDTFDPKPEAPADIRGEFQAIETSVSGIRISEYFPRFAKLMQHAAVLRGMSTLESDHKLATYHLHTGYQNRAGAVSFPSLGAIVAKELGQRDIRWTSRTGVGAPVDQRILPQPLMLDQRCNHRSTDEVF